MADQETKGGMRANMARILGRTPSPQTKEEQIAYLQILDWINKAGGRGAGGAGGAGGSPLSSLLSRGEKLPAEMATRNWPSGRQTPRSWIKERLRGSNVPGARLGQWMKNGLFTNTPWRTTKTLKNIPYDLLKSIQGDVLLRDTAQSGKVPRELKSFGEIKKDVHSIASAKANLSLGPPKRGEAFNSAARQSALLKKILARLALKGIPIAGAAASAVSDAHRKFTDPEYTTPAYLLDQAENVSYLGGLGTGLAGSGIRLAGEKGVEAIKEQMEKFRNLSDLEKFKLIGGLEWPLKYWKDNAAFRRGDYDY